MKIRIRFKLGSRIRYALCSIVHFEFSPTYVVVNKPMSCSTHFNHPTVIYHPLMELIHVPNQLASSEPAPVLTCNSVQRKNSHNLKNQLRGSIGGPDLAFVLKQGPTTCAFYRSTYVRALPSFNFLFLLLPIPSCLRPHSLL